MKNIQIAYEILSESRKLREKFNVTGKQFDKVHANIYSIFECYAHGIIDWDQSKNRLKTAIREYVSLYKGTSAFKEEKAKMLKEYNRIVKEYKPVLDTYKRVSEQKMTKTLLNNGQLNESQAQEKSKLYFNRVLADYEVSDTALSESWNEVMQEYPNLTVKDEARVRMLTIFEGPTIDTTQMITTIAEEPTAISGPMQTSMRPRLRPRDMEDPGFEFNPNAGLRDQPDHPENKGLTNPRSTSPRPRPRPANLGQRAAIDAAVRSAMGEGWKELPPIDRDRYQERSGLEGPFQTMAGKVVYYDPQEGAYYDPDTDMYLSYDEFKALDNDRTGMETEGHSPHPKGSAKYKKHMAAMHAEADEKNVKGFDAKTISSLADLKVDYPHAPDTLSAILRALEDVKRASKRDDHAIDKDVDKLEKRVNDLEKDHTKMATEDMSDDEIDAFHRALDALVHKHLGHSSDEVDERKMTKAEKSKEKRLKKKYDDSDMKASMKKQYGDDWEAVYYATIRKQAMEAEVNEARWEFKPNRTYMVGNQLTYDDKYEFYLSPEDAEILNAFMQKADSDETRKNIWRMFWSSEETGDTAEGPVKAIAYAKKALGISEGHAPDHNMKARMRLQKIMQQAIKDSKKKRGIEDEDEKDRTDEMTSAGAVATVAQPMGKMQRRNKVKEDQMMTEAEFDEAAGEKDACYHKVKSRYKVWPSAYASGALVQCRKVGAKNWGNKSK